MCLMDLATIEMKKQVADGRLADMEVTEEINACSIEADVDVSGEKVPYLIMFKNETHNHPTEIEPYGGASTCLGGAIRDPFRTILCVSLHACFRGSRSKNPN